MPTLKENITDKFNFEQLQSQATQTIGLKCPCCQSASYMKHGTTKLKSTSSAKQRYKCKQCGKTFHTDHGTPYYRLRKREATIQYLQAMFDGLSIRAAAKKVGISVKTSFQWRHKFLSSINKNSTFTVGETIGIQEIRLPYSSKGTPVDPSKKRSLSRTVLQLSATGKINLTHLPPHKLVRTASTVIANTTKSSMYIYQSSKLITSALVQSGKAHQIVKDRNLTSQHIHQMNHKVREIETWMAPFRGVATKYLAQYWRWYTIVSKMQTESDFTQFTEECVSGRQIKDIPFSA